MMFVDPGACSAACMLFAAVGRRLGRGASRRRGARPWAAVPGATAGLRLVPAGAARPVALRPAVAADAAAQRALCQAVSARNLGLCGAGALSAEGLAQATDDARALSLVALGGAAQAPQLIGLVRLCVDPDGVAGEFALIVHPSAQGRGVGRLLLERLLAECRRRGLLLVRAAALAGNLRMLALARACHFQLLPAADGTVELVQVLARRGEVPR